MARSGQLEDEFNTLWGRVKASLAEARAVRAEVEAVWQTIARCWDIEPRTYFEAEAPINGFRYPLRQALHHIWKREPKVAALWWRDVRLELPVLTPEQRDPCATGVPVQVYPPYCEHGASVTHFAYYGCRYGDGVTPVFYVYGRVLPVTHWAPVLPPP